MTIFSEKKKKNTLHSWFGFFFCSFQRCNLLYWRKFFCESNDILARTAARRTGNGTPPLKTAYDSSNSGGLKNRKIFEEAALTQLYRVHHLRRSGLPCTRVASYFVVMNCMTFIIYIFLRGGGREKAYYSMFVNSFSLFWRKREKLHLFFYYIIIIISLNHYWHSLLVPVVNSQQHNGIQCCKIKIKIWRDFNYCCSSRNNHNYTTQLLQFLWFHIKKK